MIVFNSDNGGHTVPPDVCAADPVVASGQSLTGGSKDADNEATVVAGARYALTALGSSGWYIGLADVTTAANIIWVCAKDQTIVITIPAGQTTLHYARNESNGTLYLRRLN